MYSLSPNIHTSIYTCMIHVIYAVKLHYAGIAYGIGVISVGRRERYCWGAPVHAILAAMRNESK